MTFMRVNSKFGHQVRPPAGRIQGSPSVDPHPFLGTLRSSAASDHRAPPRVPRPMPRRHSRRERSNHTLQPTALVNEAWLRLQNDRGAALPGRTQGLALAAQAMRRVLVDHGRHQKSQKRGGRLPHVELDDLLHAARTAAVPVEDLLTLESALTRLEAIDARGAEVVALRFFSGLSVPEVADHLGVSVSTVEGKWTHARAWLRRDLAGTEPGD